MTFKPSTRIKAYKNYWIPEFSYSPMDKFSWAPIKPAGSVCHSLSQAKEAIDDYLEGLDFEIIQYP